MDARPGLCVRAIYTRYSRRKVMAAGRASMIARHGTHVYLILINEAITTLLALVLCQWWKELDSVMSVPLVAHSLNPSVQSTFCSMPALSVELILCPKF